MQQQESYIKQESIRKLMDGQINILDKGFKGIVCFFKLVLQFLSLLIHSWWEQNPQQPLLNSSCHKSIGLWGQTQRAPGGRHRATGWNVTPAGISWLRTFDPLVSECRCREADCQWGMSLSLSLSLSFSTFLQSFLTTRFHLRVHVAFAPAG